MLAGTSCTDWLDVRPRTETPADEMFSTQKGFKDALTGAYIRMKSANIYGTELSWGTAELLAQHWYNFGVGTHGQFSSYNYTNQYVQERFASIFETLYKVIADANGILQVIDEKQDIFSDGYYELIKGEALALRAFCHFDVLRLFGPIPTQPSESNLVLPYVKTVTNKIHPHLTYQQFTKALTDDLDEAEKLLKNVDPILDYSLAELNPSTSASGPFDDNYLWYRQIRMNYYAVKAIQARVLLWLGDKTNAAACANTVIEAKTPGGATMYRLGLASDMTNADYSLTCEHIFALNVRDLETRQNSYMGEGTNITGAQGAFRQMEYYVNQAFEFSVTDIRRVYLWKTPPASTDAGFLHSIKFKQPTTPFNQIPLVRLAEMYLIAAECAPTVADGMEILNELKTSRGATAKALTSEVDFQTELVWEYQRELYGEGQGFFAYKRLNRATINWAVKAGSPEVYIVPMPDREINFNNN